MRPNLLRRVPLALLLAACALAAACAHSPRPANARPLPPAPASQALLSLEAHPGPGNRFHPDDPELLALARLDATRCERDPRQCSYVGAVEIVALARACALHVALNSPAQRGPGAYEDRIARSMAFADAKLAAELRAWPFLNADPELRDAAFAADNPLRDAIEAKLDRALFNRDGFLFLQCLRLDIAAGSFDPAALSALVNKRAIGGAAYRESLLPEDPPLTRAPDFSDLRSPRNFRDGPVLGPAYDLR